MSFLISGGCLIVLLALVVAAEVRRYRRTVRHRGEQIPPRRREW